MPDDLTAEIPAVLVLSEASARLVMDLLESPPEPTPALRALMAGEPGEDPPQ